MTVGATTQAAIIFVERIVDYSRHPSVRACTPQAR